MSKVLFVPVMEKGHVHPLIGVLQLLQKEGHRIACYGIRRDPIAAQFSAAGIECSWFPVQGGGRGESASAQKNAHLNDPKRLLRWCALGIARSLDAGNVDALRAAIREFKPDVLCADPLAYHGCVAAELEGIPWAAIPATMVSAADPAWRCPWIDAMEELRPMVLATMRERGVTTVRLRSCDAVSPWLNTVFVPEAFAPRAWSRNEDSWFLGPSRPVASRGDEPEFPWERLRRDVPVVYVSSGGGQALSFDPQVILTICRSLPPREAQFVCALQGLDDESFVSQLPDSCIAVRYAPQMRLLESHAAVAVTHGGVNSVTECLTYGRPMLVLPIGLDHPIQARAVERSGVGLALEVSELSVQDCRSALLRLLDPAEGFRRSLEPIRRACSVNGAVKAAELIAALARARRPMPAGPF